MNQTARILLKIFLGLVLLVVFAVTVLTIMFVSSDPNKYKSSLTAKIKEETGADLVIDGNFEVSAFPSPGVVMERARLGFGVNGNQHIEFEAEQVRIDFDLLSLVGTEYQVKKFVTDNFKLTHREKSKKPSVLVGSYMEGRISRTCCGIDIPYLLLKSDNSEAELSIYIDTDESPIKVSGKADLSDFRIDAFMSGKASSAPASNKVIPRVELPFDLTDKVHFDLQVRANRWHLGQHQLEKVQLKLSNAPGKLVAHPISGKLWGGAFDGRIELQPTGPGQGLTQVQVNISQANFERALGKKDVQGGRFDLSLKGQGHGRHTQVMASNFSGDLSFDMRGAKLLNKSIQSDLLGSVFQFLSPVKESKHTDIQCAVVRFNIKKGTALAANRIAAETNNLDVIGSGKVDLGTEAIDLEFNLRKKSGISIDLGSFDKYFRIKGTMANPKVELDPKGLIEEGLSIFGTIASGGLSLVAEQVFDKIGEKGSPCAEVANN